MVETPDLQLHCWSAACNGARFFRFSSANSPTIDDKWKFFHLQYRCSNCQASEKLFSLHARATDLNNHEGEAEKLGEKPTFGPTTPARLINLVGPDREDFLKGRRCENQGLGVGAFIYYRRVVENQKNRIIGEIIRVAEKISAPESTVAELKAAMEETQFTKALQTTKKAIPQALLIDGHNPLQLLHTALSDGVHGRSDAECLELASGVRVVLAELSERLGHVLKDEAELSKAVSTLLAPRKRPAT